jgi:anti-anti-sigma factor
MSMPEIIFHSEQSAPVIGAVAKSGLDKNRSQQLRSIMLAAGFKDKQVAIDLSRVEFVDSEAMGCFLSLKALMADGNHVLYLSGLNRLVRQIFGIEGFDSLFEIHGCLCEAVAAVQLEQSRSVSCQKNSMSS